ncbi:MAG: monovalent cation/H(+) antiporter subunit G [Rhizobiaceae bacterium]|nr:monovalent cation/H(+) antiporter subunit G [Rhizobiaceae bacterium]
MSILVEVLSWVFLIGGSVCVIIGSIGTTRFPDFWSRLHAASITDSAGMILLILGMCLQAGFTLITVKLIIIGIFLFITGPTTTHAVANAAWVSGLRPDKNTSFKEPTTKTGKSSNQKPNKN